MKKNTFNIGSALKGLVAGILTLAYCQADAPSRTLVLLQENSGRTTFTDDLPVALRVPVQAIVDRSVETTEEAKFATLAAGHYQKFVSLTDRRCTRTELFRTLVNESAAGNVIDLVVLGHGYYDSLSLYGNETLRGVTPSDSGNLRSLLTDARNLRGPRFNFNLRLVYMCNCMGSSLNDDWIAIGAKTSIGPIGYNALHEPMITLFWNDFVLNDKRAGQAADDSYAAASAAYRLVPGFNTVAPDTGRTRIEDARQITLGQRDIIFRDECQLRVNESRSFYVYARNTHTFPGIYLVNGQTYSIKATGTWYNGSTPSGADGYLPLPFLDSLRRYPNWNMMRLVGERFRHNGDASPLSFVSSSGFSIGNDRTYTSAGYGFLGLFANDALPAYGDNSGRVQVTVKRTR